MLDSAPLANMPPNEFGVVSADIGSTLCCIISHTGKCQMNQPRMHICLLMMIRLHAWNYSQKRQCVYNAFVCFDINSIVS